MTELAWKRGEGKYSHIESVWWSDFKKAGWHQIGPFAAFADQNGYLIPGVTVQDKGYEYKSRIFDKKDKSGKVYKIERAQLVPGEKSEEQIAHESANREYADGARKGHEENVAMHKEEMAKIDQLIIAINALTDAITAKRKEGGE